VSRRAVIGMRWRSEPRGWTADVACWASVARASNVDGQAAPGDGALGGGELGSNVPNRSAALGEAVDDLLLFGGREIVVPDVVAGHGTVDNNLVDVVVRWGSAGGWLGRGVGVDVVSGQRWHRHGFVAPG
jgi:hypothetical protein